MGLSFHIDNQFKSMIKTKSAFKLPQYINLGTILPCQYGESILPLQSSQIAFLELSLSQQALQNGFFLIKQGSENCQPHLQFALKPNKQINICIGSYAGQLKKSTTFSGQLYIAEQNLMHTIKLSYRVQVPCLYNKKMLRIGQDNIYRIMINKSVTNQVRIMLENRQDYQLKLNIKLLFPVSMDNKQVPFLIKVKNPSINAQPKQTFVIFLTLETNIRYKKQFKGLKKCILRNVLCLKTSSQLFYTLPVEIISVFIKEPVFKSQ